MSKGGRELLKMLEKEKLEIANSLDVCEGTWTREESGSKSILDYVIVNEGMSAYIKRMKIYDGGNRGVAPFHLKRISAKKIKTVYSDHNPIIMETNLVMKQIDAEEKKKRRVLTEEGKVKYRQELEEKSQQNMGQCQ